MCLFAIYIEIKTDYPQYRKEKVTEYELAVREEKMKEMRVLAKEMMEKYPNDEERLAQILFLMNEIYSETQKSVRFP